MEKYSWMDMDSGLFSRFMVLEEPSGMSGIIFLWSGVTLKTANLLVPFLTSSYSSLQDGSMSMSRKDMIFGH